MSKKYTPRSDDPWDKEKEEDPGHKEKEVEKKLWFDKISLPNLAEPTIIVVITTAFFYAVVAGYYISYFKRLSISFYSLDLPLTFYLYAGNNIIYSVFWLITLITLINTAYNAVRVYKKIKKDKTVIFMYLTFILYSISVIVFIFSLIKNVFALLSILSIILGFIIILLLYYPKKESYETFEFKSTFVLYIFLFFIFLPSVLGVFSAESLIRGDAGSLEVKLDLVNKNPDLLDKTLMLVIHSDSKYYLVEKNESLPKEANIYIIPDDQIKMITVKPVEKEPRKFYQFYKDWRWI